MKRGGRALAAALSASLLGACATPGAPRAYFLEDGYARYYTSDAGRTLRVEKDGSVRDITCLPLETAQDKPLEKLPRTLCASADIPLLGTAARAGADWDMAPYSVPAVDGRCAPLLRAPTLDWREDNRRESCWNRLWEVPAALVVYPVAAVVLIGAATVPIWLPILLLK